MIYAVMLLLFLAAVYWVYREAKSAPLVEREEDLQYFYWDKKQRKWVDSRTIV